MSKEKKNVCKSLIEMEAESETTVGALAAQVVASDGREFWSSYSYKLHLRKNFVLRPKGIKIKAPRPWN